MFYGGRVKRVILFIFIFNLHKLRILFYSYHYSTLLLWLQNMAPNKPDVFYSKRIPGISVSFQRSFLYYANWFSLLTLLLSIWCFVSNVIILIGLLRSGIRSLRPGLLIVCSLAFSDLLWGATVAPIYTGFSEVSWQMYEMVETNFGNTSHDVFSNPPRDHLVLPNAAFKLDVICILTPRSPPNLLTTIAREQRLYLYWNLFRQTYLKRK